MKHTFFYTYTISSGQKLIHEEIIKVIVTGDIRDIRVMSIIYFTRVTLWKRFISEQAKHPTHSVFPIHKRINSNHHTPTDLLTPLLGDNLEQTYNKQQQTKDITQGYFLAEPFEIT